MKRVLTLVLMATLSVSVLAGCSSSKSGSTDKKLTVGTTIYKFDDTFMTGVRNAITTQATSDKVTADIVDSQNSTSTQNDKLDLFITKKVSSLAINPVDPKASSTIISKAKSANIPIVFFNRVPSESDMNSWDKLYYVGAKAEQSGTIQGKIMAEYWKAHPEADKNHNGVLDYVMITGEPGNTDAIARTKYSIDELTAEGIKSNQIATDTGMWDRVKAQDKMQSFLTSKGNQIEAVFANNDDMALGAIEALKAAGYFTGGKYIPVVGVDATAPGIKAIEEGTMLGTVLNDSKNQGIATLKLAEVLAQGKTPSKENTGYEIKDKKYVWIDYKKITKDNVKDAK
ncbi:galactose ABC transporter substrate-binding protein [Inconstantimicrobium mannanitabidum]|uniref:Galactose ABC transporter substrate-binding protein n=1 Tax=Inconstantimicrobium mannanitabidum TaxID=1604901 RepID=A0ACB5RGM4_9CLOT|nr:galactose ABC transporter substrate-binding protein [Clostridium sp. TW13]GKX68248.1 galactose ABC transporter substrate-binding protein [Clostridium sp. TW13]